jgi:hypothetical protein
MSLSLNISAKLKSSRFGSDEVIKAMVVQWFQQQCTQFLVEGDPLNGFQLNKPHDWKPCSSNRLTHKIQKAWSNEKCNLTTAIHFYFEIGQTTYGLLPLNFCLSESQNMEFEQPCLTLSPLFSVLIKYELAYCHSQAFNCKAAEYRNVYIYVTIQYYHYQPLTVTNYRNILAQLCLILCYKFVTYYTKPTEIVKSS